MVILAQSAATSRAYAMKYNDSFDENIDLVGLGTGRTSRRASRGTYVVNGSPTKTEMVDSAGGQPGLAADRRPDRRRRPVVPDRPVVVHAERGPGGGRVPDRGRAGRYHGMRDVLRRRPGEFAVAAVTAAVVVIVGVEQGIILAIALSIVEHIYHSYKPSDHLLGIGPMASLDNDDRIGSQIGPGLAVYRFRASLYYANTARFTEEVVGLAEDADPPLRWLAISGSVIEDIDYQGSQAIRR